ncbi:MAG: PAS domain S-box protein [Anaerolineaceae bacterium]|nr:PAS domain S-box protein [Anaerolineaceae bacterium]
MDRSISTELLHRLERIAQQRHCSLEELLTVYADHAEDIRFPGDPYRFFELTDAFVCVTDQNGVLLYVNPTFCQVLGYEEAHLIGQPYLSFVHPDDMTATKAAEKQLKAERTIVQFENRFRCQNGRYRSLVWVSTRNEQHTYAIALDVTNTKLMEQQLEQASKENERIVRSIFDGYLLGDVTGTILEVNQAYCNMVGYTREELLQKTVFELDAGIPPPQINKNTDQIIRDDILMVIETQHRHKNGNLVDVEINSVQFQNRQIACFIRDISQRKRLERQIRHNEQLYRGLIESQIDFVCRYTPDTLLTYANDAYCRFMGVPQDTVIGMSFLTLTKNADTKPIFDRIREVLRDPSPDVRVFSAEGSTGKKRWIQWIDYGITDEAGAVVEIQAVGRDITQLIETQERLAEREDTLSTIFKNIPVMLVQLDQERRYQYVNQHWVDVLGWTLEEIQTHPNIMAEFYPDPEYRAEVMSVITAAEGDWHDFKTRTRDGTFVDTSWANIWLSNERRLGIGQVITHRIELENQRIYAHQLEMELVKERELRELKDHFVSLVSHEFRTPLSAMTTTVSLVVDYFDRLSREQVLEKLTQIRQQIRRMVDMMEDALRFSRSDAGMTEFSPVEVKVSTLCQKVIDTLQLVDDYQHTIILEADSGSVQADPRLLDHVLTNLLANAIKYSPAGTAINIEVTRQADFWQFAVQDEGIGVPEDDLSRLFEPFYRATNVRNLPGTGLGLSIVRDYVILHGGDIKVESTIGVGTTFIFTLPA